MSKYDNFEKYNDNYKDISKEIEILSNKKNEISIMLENSTSKYLSDAFKQELRKINNKLEYLKQNTRANAEITFQEKFIDVYDNKDSNNEVNFHKKNYLSNKKSNYDISQVIDLNSNDVTEIQTNETDNIRRIDPIEIKKDTNFFNSKEEKTNSKDKKDTNFFNSKKDTNFFNSKKIIEEDYDPDNKLLNIYRRYVKKNSESSKNEINKSSNTSNTSNDTLNQCLIDCKNILDIVRSLQKRDKNNKLIDKLKNNTKCLAKRLNKHIKSTN